VLLKRILKSKTTYFYLVPLLAVTIGWLVFSSDETPPAISSFEISPTNSVLTEEGLVLSYSGTLTDSRGITEAHFLCKQAQQATLQLYLGFTSAEANLVSFGVLPGSPSWQGAWVGTSQNLTFQGTGRVPAGFSGTECNWSVTLTDLLGNSIEIELPNRTVITK
jgi:hypothetical protein